MKCNQARRLQDLATERAVKVQQLELDLAFYEGQAERTRIKQEMRFPKEPKGQGTVVKFLVQFNPTVRCISTGQPVHVGLGG